MSLVNLSARAGHVFMSSIFNKAHMPATMTFVVPQEASCALGPVAVLLGQEESTTWKLES